jgi:hypothetical protein
MGGVMDSPEDKMYLEERKNAFEALEGKTITVVLCDEEWVELWFSDKTIIKMKIEEGVHNPTIGIDVLRWTY